MSQIRKTQTLTVIREAFRLGFSVDKVNGQIFGRKGTPLTLSKTGKQRYPCVTLYVPTLKYLRENPSFAIHAHKIMAYGIWGNKAFTKGMEIRHLGGVMDIREVSLSLGTAHENMMDIDPKIRQRAAKVARASQGRLPTNRSVTPGNAEFIKNTARRDMDGTPKVGEITRLSKKFGVAPHVVKLILIGKNYE